METKKTKFDKTELDLSIIDTTPLSFLQKYNILPIKTTNNYLNIAYYEPDTINHTNLIEQRFKQPIKFIQSDKNKIKQILLQLSLKEELLPILDKSNSLNNDIDEENPLIMDIITSLIELAIRKNSSDIHIESRVNNIQIRFRIDGILRDIVLLPKTIQNILSVKIKLLSSMNIAETKDAQDGRFSMNIDNKKIDFRVSVVPIIEGESIVIRILDSDVALRELKDLNISYSNLALLKKAINQPNGLILVTGPTGCGKTTTLYALLNHIKEQNKKIITIEEPVEYKIKNLNQINISPSSKLTFASALRSVLRQDPDIIMVGEIRDLQTLNIAIKASLSGHLVLCTLHSNNAINAIDRLLDMGADSFMLSSALCAIQAQRLIKKLCPNCKKPSNDKKDYELADTVLYEASGCEMCDFVGYKSRIVISEMFFMDKELKTAIAKKQDIEPILKQKNYQTMWQDGLKYLKSSQTSIKEVLSVLRIDE